MSYLTALHDGKSGPPAGGPETALAGLLAHVDCGRGGDTSLRAWRPTSWAARMVWYRALPTDINRWRSSVVGAPTPRIQRPTVQEWTPRSRATCRRHHFP